MLLVEHGNTVGATALDAVGVDPVDEFRKLRARCFGRLRVGRGRLVRRCAAPQVGEEQVFVWGLQPFEHCVQMVSATVGLSQGRDLNR